MSGRLVLVCLIVVGVGIARADDDNPHRDMATDQAVCLDCHTKIPQAEEHAADYFLVDAPSDNCLGCHAETAHPGALEHAGREAAPLPGDEHGKIACFTCHDPHPDGTIAGRRVYPSDVHVRTRAFAMRRKLPTSVEHRPSEAMRGAMLRAPAAGGAICLPCHTNVREEQRPWRERLLRDRYMPLFSY